MNERDKSAEEPRQPLAPARGEEWTLNPCPRCWYPDPDPNCPQCGGYGELDHPSWGAHPDNTTPAPLAVVALIRKWVKEYELAQTGLQNTGRVTAAIDFRQYLDTLTRARCVEGYVDECGDFERDVATVMASIELDGLIASGTRVTVVIEEDK